MSDKYLTSRILKAVRNGIALDQTNERGKRILSNDNAKTVLKGFKLNGNTNLSTVAPIKINLTISDTETTIDLQNLTDAPASINDLFAPLGTTHVMAVGIASTVNLNPDILTVKEVKAARSGKVSGNEPITLPTLTYSAIEGENLVIVAIPLKFYQEVNGEHYQLQNGQHDVAQILGLYWREDD